MSSANWIGQTLGGKYQIANHLSEDGFAVTYKAYDNNIRDAVAVKLVLSELAQNPQFPGRFASASAAIAQLRHPNLNRVLDYAHDKGIYYVVSELREGESLMGRIRKLAQAGQLMALDDLLRIGQEISDGLQYAHSNGQIHQSVSPARIQFKDDGSAILMDLGMLQITGAQLSAETATAATAPYLAPEQLNGQAATEQSDLYALGVTMFQMLSGRLPFSSGSVTKIMQAGASEAAPDVRNFRRDTPAKLAALVARLLQKEPGNRVKSAAIVNKALVSLAAETTGGATMVEAPHDATMVQQPDDATMIDSPAVGAPLGGATVVQSDDDGTVIERTVAPPPPAHDPTKVQRSAPPVVDPNRTVVEDDMATSVESYEPAPPPLYKPAGNAPTHEDAVRTELLGQSVPPTTIDQPSFISEPAPAGRRPAAGAPVITPEKPKTVKKKSRTPLLIGCGALIFVALCAASLFAVFATPLGDTLQSALFGEQTATVTVVAEATAEATVAEIAEATEALAEATPVLDEGTEEATEAAVAPTDTLAPTETEAPPTATVPAATATIEPTATLQPTATLIPATATQAGPAVQISSITLEGSTYIVNYSTVGYTEALPGMHVHFFFNTVPPEQAGLPGGGPWVVWGGPRPFNGYSTGDRPGAATQMCALVANPDHSVIQSSGNCVNLP